MIFEKLIPHIIDSLNRYGSVLCNSLIPYMVCFPAAIQHQQYTSSCNFMGVVDANFYYVSQVLLFFCFQIDFFIFHVVLTPLE